MKFFLTITFSMLLALLLVVSCSSDDKDDGNDDQSDDDISHDQFPFDPGDPIEPTDGFVERRNEYLQVCSENNAPPSGGLHGQLCRFATNAESINEQAIINAMDKINAREDCSDFDLATLVRILHQYAEHSLLSSELKDSIEQTILDFKYWMDEPNEDSMCFWSENHQILFHSNELLAGHLFLNDTFSNSGMTGEEHVDKAANMTRLWLNWRARFGFSEWHSNVYYVEDIPALANLADFAPFEDIRIRAAMLLDILAMDISLNSFDGIFGTTHGRTYPEKVMGARSESTRTINWLWHGTGSYNSTGDFAACHIATSTSYVLPPILEAIGQDEKASPFVNKERASIDVENAQEFGFTYEDYDSVTFFWGMSAYAVWQVIEASLKMVKDYKMFQNNHFLWSKLSFLEPFVGTGVASKLTKTFDPIARGPALETVNTYTYRTPSYQLSCAQDYNKGLWAAQQHIWQATLDIDAAVFTTYPGGMEDYMATSWTGGWLPRAGQFENVIVILYDRPTIPLIDSLFPSYTHAYFPKGAFDEWTQNGNWSFGRKGQAYLALYSANPTSWATELPNSEYELIADGKSNIWVCELGDEKSFGSFENFVNAIGSSSITTNALSVEYDSPTVGAISFSWDGSLIVDGNEVDFGPYLRFDNKYIEHEFDSLKYSVERNDSRLELDFKVPRRRYWK